MLHTGLSKGVMRCSGIGPEHVWTLTNQKGRMDSVWKLFRDRLPNLQESTFFIGREHFSLRKSDHCPWKNRIKRNCLKRLSVGENIEGTRLAHIIAGIDAVARALDGREVRIFNNMFLFEIMSKEFYEELQSCGEEKMPGLYANRHGFCPVSHQKRACRIFKEDPCIFVKKGLIANGADMPMNRYYCGKFNCRFASDRLAMLKLKKISGFIGDCENLRGFEI